MKPFESFLKPQIQQYIEYRHNLGYSDKALKTRLLMLDQFLCTKKTHWDSLNPSLFLEFRKQLTGAPTTVNETIRAVRGFWEFLVRHEHCAENPLADIPPYTEPAYIPFIFSSEETEQLLEAIQKRLRKTDMHFLTDLTVYLAIVLLARCGLRISEPLRLLRTHYRASEGTFYIEKTKFKKDRLIPAPKSAMVEIENYLAVRKSLCAPDYNPYLLSGQNQRPLSTKPVYRVFHQALKDIGLDQPRRMIANVTFGSPTPHSLRHSFAVNTLKQIKERGKSPQAALPILAAYMGHRKYRYTAVYLKVLDANQRQQLVDFNISRQKDL